MLSSLAVLTVCSAAALVLEERLPLAMVVISGDADAESAYSVADVVRNASAALSRHTSLSVLPEVKTAADRSIAACDAQRRVTCWVNAVRSDQLEPRYLLVVSYFLEPSAGVRLATLLIDVPGAKRVEVSADQTQPGWQDRVEEEISQRAAAANDVLLGGEEKLAAYFETLIAEKFRADFEANQHFEPYGTIELEAPRAGFQILLDGSLVGTSSAGITVLTNVLPGRRTIELVDPSDKAARIETTLVVRTNEKAIFSARAVKAVDDSGPMSVQLTFWTGVGLAAAGTVLTAWSLTADPQPGRTFATLCEVTERNASCLEKGGPLGAPLGYSLAITGAIWAFGTRISDSDEAPWIPFVLGLVAGAIAYGVSSALDGGTPAEVK